LEHFCRAAPYAPPKHAFVGVRKEEGREGGWKGGGFMCVLRCSHILN
jgi:hypothetical protein